jgi:hypothetical protein
MKLKHLILLFYIFLALRSNGQEIKFSLQTGYGAYNMSTLKGITKSVLGQLAFDAKIMSNYPPFLYYQPMIKFCGNHFDFGFTYTYQSTGSRISSKDYSGEYRFDSRIFSNSPGIIISKDLEDFDKFKLRGSMQVGINFSTLKMNEYIHLDTFINKSDFKLTAQSFYFEPGIIISVPVMQFFLELNLGYHKEFLRKDFELKGNSQNGISLNKKFVDSDIWDGWRLGITISYTLPSGKDNK